MAACLLDLLDEMGRLFWGTRGGDYEVTPFQDFAGQF